MGWDGCGILPDAVRGRTRAAALVGLLCAAAPGCTAGPALYVGEADAPVVTGPAVSGGQPAPSGGQPAPSRDPVADAAGPSADPLADAAAGMDTGPADAGASVCGVQDCGGATPYCDEAAGRCVECLEDAHCQGDLPRCFSTNVCVECVTNDDCGSNLCQIFEGHCLGFGF